MFDPRGIRNNNPFNIRHVAGVTWQGQSATQTDDSFVQFDDPVYGIRAGCRILKSYEREGISSIQDAIDRFAPPNENNSVAYVTAVSTVCGVNPTAMISLTSYLPCLCRGIIRHENGINPYTDDQINQGIALA